MVEAVQRGRTEAEVEAEFHRIEEELQARITADMQDARRKVFDNLDRDVVARLRQRGDDIQITLDAFEQRLLAIAKAELPSAHFHTANGPRFDFNGKTWTTEWPLADEKGWQFSFGRRLAGRGDCDARAASKRANRDADLRLCLLSRCGLAPTLQCGRLAGRAGWLTISLLSMKSVDPEIGQRDRLIVAGFCDEAADGTEIDQATVDDLFLVPAIIASPPAEPLPADRMAGQEAEARQAVLAQIEDESRRWLDEETEKLDAVACRRPRAGRRAAGKEMEDRNSGPRRKRYAATRPSA